MIGDHDKKILENIGTMARPLSFRDQSAIAAMQAFLASPKTTSGNLDAKDFINLATSYAFDVADSMDAERKKRNKETD